MAILKKVLKIVYDILFAIIAILAFFAVVVFFQVKIQKKDYPNIFGYTFFEVVSGSMSPSIETYDLIIVKLNENYKINDVITFMDKGDFITHRIIEINDNNILTKGDANNTNDKYIDKNTIIGKVIYVLPKVGIYKRILGNSGVIIWLFIGLVLFSISLSLKERKEK